MGLFDKRAKIDPAVPRSTALVMEADAPPQGAPSLGRDSHGRIQVLVDTPAGAHQQLAATFKYADDRWLAAGMDAPVILDPAHPDTFEVDWAAVPSMQQQVAANHAALADPFAALRRLAGLLEITPSEKTAAQYERLQTAVSEAGTKPSPDGRLRAVAIMVTVRGRYSSSDGGDADGGGPTHTSVSLLSNSPAVLSVWIPGEQPYAAYLPKFKVPKSHLTLPGEPLPALVNAADRQDVEIVWSEMAGLGDQIAARISDTARASDRFEAAMGEQVAAATAQAATTGAPMAGAGMPPAMRQMMIDNLKRSLSSIPDGAQRKQILEQYRTMGLDISPEELGL
jgi:hypothetical protein